MRRYKLAIHILVILSVFSFVLVLAAPIATQEASEACADVADRDKGEDVIIVSGKRGLENRGSEPEYGSTSSSPESIVSVPLSSPSPAKAEEGNLIHQEYNWTPNTEIGPASSTSGENTPKVPPSSPEQEGHLAQTKPNSVWGNLVSKSKSLFRKLATAYKGFIGELVDNPHLQIRIFDNAAQKLQGAVHTVSSSVVARAKPLPVVAWFPDIGDGDSPIAGFSNARVAQEAQ